MLDLEKYSKIVVANWKMNGSFKFIDDFVEKLDLLENSDSSTCKVICPPFTYLDYFSNKLQNINYGAQECSKYHEGPYTGDISAEMLKDLNCHFCILGHSERRNFYNEKSSDVAKKSSNCINFDIHPIICVGENLEERKLNKTKDILKKQIDESIPKIANKKNTIIAYEPVWAIGTGLTPTLDEINQIHEYLKESTKYSEGFRIIYGGSVKSSNFKEIIELENVDGVLIGGASLNFEEFKKILEFTYSS